MELLFLLQGDSGGSPICHGIISGITTWGPLLEDTQMRQGILQPHTKNILQTLLIMHWVEENLKDMKNWAVEEKEENLKESELGNNKREINASEENEILNESYEDEIGGNDFPWYEDDISYSRRKPHPKFTGKRRYKTTYKENQRVRGYAPKPKHSVKTAPAIVW